MHGLCFFLDGPNFAFFHRPRVVNRRHRIKKYAHEHTFFTRQRYFMSFQEHSYQNLGKQGSEITCSFLHFESGGLAFGRSPKNIFQMFHHDFLGIANKIQPCCREYSCKCWYKIHCIVLFRLRITSYYKAKISKNFPNSQFVNVGNYHKDEEL